MELKEMYLDEYNTKLDEGRLIIAAGFRRTYKERTKSDMEKLYGFVENIDGFHFYSFHEEDDSGRDELDIRDISSMKKSQGKRVMIPVHVRRTLGLELKSKVVVCGSEDSFHLWNPETFQDYQDYIRGPIEPDLKQYFLRLLWLSHTSRS